MNWNKLWSNPSISKSRLSWIGPWLAQLQTSTALLGLVLCCHRYHDDRPLDRWSPCYHKKQPIHDSFENITNTGLILRCCNSSLLFDFLYVITVSIKEMSHRISDSGVFQTWGDPKNDDIRYSGAQLSHSLTLKRKMTCATVDQHFLVWMCEQNAQFRMKSLSSILYGLVYFSIACNWQHPLEPSDWLDEHFIHPLILTRVVHVWHQLEEILWPLWTNN